MGSKEQKSEYDKEYYQNNKEKVSERGKLNYIKNKEKIKERRSKNKKERSEYDKKRYSGDYGKIKRQKRKEDYYNNPEKYKKAGRLRRELFPDKIRESKKKAYYKRFESDPLFRFKIKTRNVVRTSFNKFSYTKKSRTFEILNCSFEDFKIYIESQFTSGMSWKNQGDWHYDHKVPLALAETQEEVIKLCHYSNFQPLWKEENLKKGSKLLPQFEELKKELLNR